jgi:hypothetical protein
MKCAGAASATVVFGPRVNRWHCTKVVGAGNDRRFMSTRPSNTDNDVFGTWHPNDGNKHFDFPDRSQSLNNIYFRATTPGHDQTDMVVLYDNASKKKLSFNGGSEITT